jgi:hypothetical protein
MLNECSGKQLWVDFSFFFFCSFNARGGEKKKNRSVAASFERANVVNKCRLDCRAFKSSRVLATKEDVGLGRYRVHLVVICPQTTDMNLGQTDCLACEHQLLICDQKSPKVGSLKFRDSSELQDSNLKFLFYCKPKWHNKANR